MQLILPFIILIMTMGITVFSVKTASSHVSTQASTAVLTPTFSPTPISSPVPPTVTPTVVPTKIIIHTTSPTLILTPTMPAPPANDLNGTVNAYRSANGRSSLATNATLCRIAVTRAAQQSQAGSLDNHAGFQGQAASQNEFLHIGEVLQYRSPQESAHYLVYTGWAGSGEHNALLLDPGWTHGCGSISGLFAAFIFGRN